ncbi:GNAT family N-acetyltransferase [Bacillus sp. B1-b2]|uniref:GNAT family N-acetyltransferase n=1 Tax=Bacillus sp. B1-b2 TaxID=2653201 RepID=UPI0012616939|nr:GNAT family N-acetyltransferase [Bacillus sp. B1-b2]KAB7665871.1 GNAT family N-acetyltransferase [Bacillus sp. B1-b2]
MQVRNVQIEDLEQLYFLENTGFTPDEAATKNAFLHRIHTISDTFIVAEENGMIIGYINGPVISEPFITDDLFKQTLPNPPKGGHQCILGIVVHPNYQNLGIASLLLAEMEKRSKLHQRLSITLTCKKELISFYEKNGYTNQGVASSQHAGVVWYNMNKGLEV